MPNSRRSFLGVTALVFATSAVATALIGASMSAMGGMPMPGGWTMSMMRMSGQAWATAAASFVGMWTVMMVAMMLPSIAPALWRYCQTAEASDSEWPGWLTTVAALGYFVVWVAIGVAVFAAAVAVAAVELQHPALASAAPIISAAIVVIAGAFQFTPWKAHYLTLCRTAATSAEPRSTNARAAWRHGVRLALRCALSCAPLTAVVLVVGVNDLRAMVIIAAAITAERLSPNGVRIARRSGVMVVAAGLFLIATSLR